MAHAVPTVEMLQAILSSIDEGIHVVNAEGKTIYYNHVIARLDGLSEREVIGKHILDVFPSLDVTSSTLLQVIKTGQPIENQPQTYTNIKGKQVDTVNTTLPIYVNDQIAGAVEVAKDISKVKQLSEKLLELQQKFNEKTQQTAGDHRELKKRKSPYYTADDFITRNSEMLALKQQLPRVASTDSPVLVYGETGTGKEIIVQAIHSASKRHKGPFIAQNCAALPASLLEGLLFGTTKGSFTGSVDRAGLFELADGGTLFLDEINSMPIELQAKLLRVLQEGSVRRVGGNKTTAVDIKVIAATNEPPFQAVKEGRLRSDLYYRINVVSLNLSPLRDRIEDIPLLIKHFLQLFCQRFERPLATLDQQVEQLMLDYQWPGNVRELEHAIEAALNLTDNQLLQLSDFPMELRLRLESLGSNTQAAAVQQEMSSRSLREHLEHEEMLWIQRAMELTNQNIMQAAALLKIPRQTLQYKLTKYNLKQE